MERKAKENYHSHHMAVKYGVARLLFMRIVKKYLTVLQKKKNSIKMHTLCYWYIIRKRLPEKNHNNNPIVNA